MVRLWAIFSARCLSVVFLFWPRNEWVSIPLGIEYQKIPADVFWYDIFDHIGKIIIALVMLSFFFWPVDLRHRFAYVVVVVLEIVDMILFRLYYRDWGFSDIPWNVVQNSVFALVVARYQFLAYKEWKNGKGRI